MQVVKSIGITALGVMMFIGIVALITEFMEVEEVAKIVVVPSLILLIGVTAYCMFQNYKVIGRG
jgi:ABC-type nickel/cobalt efflux system permease component RcnA